MIDTLRRQNTLGFWAEAAVIASIALAFIAAMVAMVSMPVHSRLMRG